MRYYQRHWLLKWSLLHCAFCLWDLISCQIRYSIPEELQLGAFVGNIADDLGLNVKELAARSFRIVPGPRKQYFDLNLNNGILSVKEYIDREQLCGSSETCPVSLETVIEKPFSLYDVEVEILDVNDNAPIFPKKQFRIEIFEGASPGTRYALQRANDPDVGTNSLQSYQLDANQYFTLNVESRNGNDDMPVLVLKMSLDREKISSHRLVLIAKDGGVPERSGSAEIIISVKDANDNTPVFSQSVYNISLSESAPKGALVIKINATDLDAGPNGEILYSFSNHASGRVRELFSLDSKTGEIRIRGNLNYEENKRFELNVQAMDKGPYAVPAYCHVLLHIVDINDNAPEVTVSTLFSPVTEDAVPGTVVALISATDKDSGENGQVKCKTAENVPFQLDSSSKKYLTLRTKQGLDRENVSRYEVTVLCSDSGSPPLTSQKVILVEVSDINDNTPRFSRPLYTAYVMENNVIGTSIFSVTAFDPDLNQNSRLNYSIQPTQVQDQSVFSYVHMQSEKGTIISQRSFDYERLKSFQFEVQVTDSGVPSLSSTVTVELVILDQNDNAPVIVHPLPEYGSTVTEIVSRFAEPGYLVAKVSATDVDSGQNARLTYEIRQATEPGLFTMSPDTGEIWTTRGIMSKDATRQRLVIAAKDNGSPPLSATMTIILSLTEGDTEMLSDVSILSEDSGSVSDISFFLVISLGITSSIFLVVLIILALKLKNNRNIFGAQNGFRNTCCCLNGRNSMNGVQKASRNLEIVPNYVEVFGGDPLSQSFRYDSCSSSGTAKRDAIFSNKYRSSSSKNNVMSGDEEMLRNVNCKNTINSEFVLEMIYYKRFWQFRWSLLYCMWVFDQISGEVRYSILEELQLGAFVGNIAEDLGLDLKELKARSFRIVPGHKKQYFEVNMNNGNLFVKEKIDRENLCGPTAACLLSLQTVIENPFTLHDVEVEILDVNDNAPTFPKNQFRLEISEAAAPGTRYPLDSAHDPDVGTNSLQSYRLLTDENFVLNVESRNANEDMPVLVLKRSLDREKVAHHRLRLIAKDAGIPPRSGTAEIIISVQDANDNTPVFAKPVCNVSLSENITRGTLVIKLNATDLDDGLNGEIIYSFTSHTAVRVRELFSLDSKTGEIRIRGNLNYEENKLFEINVQATDKGPYAVPAYCLVLVHVVDINDNVPEVTVSTLFSPVNEDSVSGTVVALISATDKDSGENGQVECKVAENVPFQLDSSSKKYLTLRTKQGLDRENVSRYEVTVMCSDSGSPPLTSQKVILVEVSDVNDNAPRFSRPLYTAYVMENNVIGTSIFSVTAFDPDLKQNSRLNYSIQSTQVQDESVFSYVHIQSEKGTIISQRSFDYERIKSFQFEVQVTDSGVPSLSSTVTVELVILDQNDNAPVIVHPLPEYGSTVTEIVSRFAEPGYLVAKVSATDADSGQNARLTYEIRQATDQGLFTISPDTGEIWTIRGIMSKDATRQRLVIAAKDNGSPPLSATMTIILSLTEGDTEMLSDVTSLFEDPGSFNHVSLYLVISLGITSSVFLIILIILAIKVHKNRNRFGVHIGYLDTCCCFEDLNGIQKASRNLELGPNYVEVFGGDPLSQSFRYDTCSTSGTVKKDTKFLDMYGSSVCKTNVPNGNDEPFRNVNIRNSRNNEVKQPNADWRFSQTHRAELNSTQYLEEEGVQRDIQREAQREVQCDVQREVPRDVQCEVSRNIQREVQRDVPCDVPRVVEKDPGGPRKLMCARPAAIPAGRDGWTLPRTAPRMQLQMTLGAHVPGTLRSQYLIPREFHTSGARISNSSVEFSAPLIASLHGPWAANQTRDHRGISSSGGRRPELDTQACGEVPCSPPGQRLSTQRLHSRDHHHALWEVNN
ncbi:uncharacterized protein LOC144505587 [Mustelus asterias]